MDWATEEPAEDSRKPLAAEIPQAQAPRHRLPVLSPSDNKGRNVRFIHLQCVLFYPGEAGIADAIASFTWIKYAEVMLEQDYISPGAPATN